MKIHTLFLDILNICLTALLIFFIYILLDNFFDLIEHKKIMFIFTLIINNSIIINYYDILNSNNLIDNIIMLLFIDIIFISIFILKNLKK